MKQPIHDLPIDKSLAKLLASCRDTIRTYLRYNPYPWSMVQAMMMFTSDILAAASLRNAYIECIDLKIMLAMRDIFGDDNP